MITEFIHLYTTNIADVKILSQKKASIKLTFFILENNWLDKAAHIIMINQQQPYYINRIFIPRRRQFSPTYHFPLDSLATHQTVSNDKHHSP